MKAIYQFRPFLDSTGWWNVAKFDTENNTRVPFSTHGPVWVYWEKQKAIKFANNINFANGYPLVKG